MLVIIFTDKGPIVQLNRTENKDGVRPVPPYPWCGCWFDGAILCSAAPKLAPPISTLILKGGGGYKPKIRSKIKHLCECEIIDFSGVFFGPFFCPIFRFGYLAPGERWQLSDPPTSADIPLHQHSLQLTEIRLLVKRRPSYQKTTIFGNPNAIEKCIYSSIFSLNMPVGNYILSWEPWITTWKLSHIFELWSHIFAINILKPNDKLFCEVQF